MVDRDFKLNVGRQGFESVNPEIRIIDGWIIEVLLYLQSSLYDNTVKSFVKITKNT